MKNKFKWIGIALLSALLIFGLVGCTEESPKKTGAKLIEVSFGTGGVVAEQTEIKNGVSKADFEAVTNFNSFENMGTVTLSASSFLKETPINLKISGGAKAMFTIGGASKPAGQLLAEGKAFTYRHNKGEIPTETITGTGNSFIFVEVVAESGKKQYYALKIVVQGESAEINNIKIGDIAGELGVPASTIAGATKGKFVLSSKTNSGILTAYHATQTTAAGQTVGVIIAKTAPSETADFPALPTTSITFEDGDTIYVRVIAQNKTNINFYVVVVEVGRDARLESLGFRAGDSAINAVGVQLGTPAANLDNVVVGMFEPGRPQKGGSGAAAYDGFRMIATTVDSLASISYAVGKTAPTTYTLYVPGATPNSTAPVLKFEKDDFLFIEVTAAVTSVKLYYKLAVTLGQEVTLFYGQPKIKDDAGKGIVDTMWAEAIHQEMDVSRRNLAEGNPGYAYLNPVDDVLGHTTAKAKAMWDDEGLYVYIDADFHDFYKSAADKNAEPPKSTARVLIPGEDHNCDNVEIFTLERLQMDFENTNYRGNQFRIGPVATANQGADKENGYGVISGEGPAEEETAEPIGLFRDSGNFASWTKVNTAGKETGYIVVAKVPWTYITSDNATEVFDENGLVKTTGKDAGPTIGMEFQLNVSTASGSRDAILTWNGIQTQAYRNATNYGKATLVLGEKTRVPPVAVAPTISVQPADTNYVISTTADATGTPALSVTATVNVGTLSYQWYKAADAKQVDTVPTGDTDKVGTNAATFAPPITTAGTSYYYVVVTNTRGAGTADESTATTISKTVTVKVTEAQVPVIVTQPRGSNYTVGTTTGVKDLKVVAATSDGGTLSYQWKSATTANGAGTDIASATSDTLTPTLPTTGSVWYWVVVTNTKGADKETATSTKARIQVFAAGTDFDFWVDLGGVGNTTAWGTGSYNAGVVYDLGISEGVDTAKYDKFTLEIEFYSDAAGETKIATLAAGQLQMKFFDNVPGDCNPGEGLPTIYNVGQNASTITNASYPSGIPAALKSIGIQTGGDKTADELFIKAIAITFHAKK